MNVLVTLLTFTSAVLSLLPVLQGRSSFIQIVEDYYLTGHVIDRHEATSVLSSTHLCLKSHPLCCSVNYGEKEGNMICELNDEGTGSAKADEPSLVPMRGYIFGRMLDLTVSKA